MISTLLGTQVHVRDTEGAVTVGELRGFRLLAGAKGSTRFEWILLSINDRRIELRGVMTIDELDEWKGGRQS